MECCAGSCDCNPTASVLSADNKGDLVASLATGVIPECKPFVINETGRIPLQRMGPILYFQRDLDTFRHFRVFFLPAFRFSRACGTFGGA
jgi:hypothetical protein